MRYFIIFNPASGNGRSISRGKKLLSMLEKSNIDYKIAETKSLDEAYYHSLNANKEGYDAVAAIGGDGTINRVLNGFYDKDGKRISAAKMAVIHTGTSPDFCKSHNIPTDFEEAFKTIIDNHSKKVMIGRIKYLKRILSCYDGRFLDEIKDNENIMTSYFGCCTNIGLGASLAKAANSGIRKYLGDFFGTLLSLIKVLSAYKPDNYKIKKDSELTFINKLLNFSAGKTFYIASGIKVKNDITDMDTRFYALSAVKNNFFSVPDIIGKIYSGKDIISNENLSLSYCGKIEIAGNSRHPDIEFDGDPQGFLPCMIDSVKEPLDLIVKKFQD